MTTPRIPFLSARLRLLCSLLGLILLAGRVNATDTVTMGTKIGTWVEVRNAGSIGTIHKKRILINGYKGTLTRSTIKNQWIVELKGNKRNGMIPKRTVSLKCRFLKRLEAPPTLSSLRSRALTAPLSGKKMTKAARRIRKTITNPARRERKKMTDAAGRERAKLTAALRERAMKKPLVKELPKNGSTNNPL